jgi:hypothetical protein
MTTDNENRKELGTEEEFRTKRRGGKAYSGFRERPIQSRGSLLKGLGVLL